MYKPRHFSLQELVCSHVYNTFGERAWSFLDERLTMTMDLLRDHLGPIYANNWDMSEEKRKEAGIPLYDERGLRCIQCSLVLKAIKEKRLYMSAHMLAQALDFDVKGKNSTEVRLWIAKNYILLPFPVRLEKSVSWVHLDVQDVGKGKVYMFNP